VRERPIPATKPRTDAPNTIIGKDTLIKGEIASQSDMLIEGRVEGKIEGAQRVVIGQDGNVNAQVHATIITVCGQVHGDCEASRKVEITTTGKVFGNITAQTIVVAEGATFRGSSKMIKPTSQPKPVTSRDASAPAKTNPTGSSVKEPPASTAH